MNENQIIAPKVAVIMSTYNGEKYLREQIDSILLQKDVALHLYVRDDGSTDSTKSILLEFQKNYKNIHLFFGTNVGVGNSFMNCLYRVGEKYDYYSFSDQDDIWLPEKIINAITTLKDNHKELYCSNQTCVDKNANVIGIRYKTVPKHGVAECLTGSKLCGCTFVFSNKLYKVLESHRPSEELLKNRIHDVWVAEIAELEGSLIYDENPYILYRQHDNNFIGAYPDNSLIVRNKRRIKRLIDVEKRNGRSALAKEIYAKFPEYRGNDIIKYAAFADTLHGKIDLIRNRKIFTQNTSSFTFVMCVIVGLF